MNRMLRGVAMTAAIFTVAAGSAQAASPDAVVGEVYGGGGNSGATLKQDFIELANRAATPVALGGKSVQYLPAAPGAATRWGVTPLEGSLPANGRYLVAEAKGSGGTVELPTPDATGTIAMAAGAGTVALVDGTAPLTCKTATDCAADTRIIDLVGYGNAAVRETSPTPALNATTAAARTGTPPVDTDNNSADFTTGAPTPTNAAGETSGGGTGPGPGGPAKTATVEQVQGPGFRSPLTGERVTGVTGVVTAVRATGSARAFWITQVVGRDDDPRTSPGLLVFTGSATPTVSVGQAVSLTGTVTEYRPANTAMSTTELTDVTVDSAVAGTPVEPTRIGRPPSNAFATTTGDAEDKASLEPNAAALDFWEAHEGEFVTTPQAADVVGPTTRFNETIVTVSPRDPGTPNGGIAINANDFNPERFKLEGLPVENVPRANVGDRFAAPTGVVDFDFNVPTIYATSPVERTDNKLQKEVTAAPRADQLVAGTINVENLSPADDDAKFAALAQQIVTNLRSPDLLALEEVQDNSGPTNNGVVAADETLAKLAAAIRTAGGPAYETRSIDPVNNQDGGQPGGNIRQVFFYRTDRGLSFTERAGGNATTPVAVGAGPALSVSPGRIEPGNAAWANSRKPLVGEFRWRDKPVFVVANHFNSKGGDQPLFGRFQPPARPSETQRRAQATEVRKFVDAVYAQDANAQVVVLGDLNDFEFSDTTKILTAGDALTDLPLTLPPGERYTYNFEGNSQILDHILLSPSLVKAGYSYDIVRTNADFVDQVSDHDPQVVRLDAAGAGPGPGPAPGSGLSDAPESIGRDATSVPVTVTCQPPGRFLCIGTVLATTTPGDAFAGGRFVLMFRGQRQVYNVPLNGRQAGAESVTLTLRDRGAVVDRVTVPVAD